MNIEDLKKGIEKATQIVDSFAAGVETSEEVVAARTAELKALNKDELVAQILELEKPKAANTVKVEDVVKAIMTDEDCALLNYEQIAALVAGKLGTKTSHKSVASYASKKGKEWGIVPRQKFKVNVDDLLAAAV